MNHLNEDHHKSYGLTENIFKCNFNNKYFNYKFTNMASFKFLVTLTPPHQHDDFDIYANSKRDTSES